VQNANRWNRRRRPYHSGLFSSSAARGESTVIQFSTYILLWGFNYNAVYTIIIKSGLTYILFFECPWGIFSTSSTAKTIKMHKIHKFPLNKIL